MRQDELGINGWAMEARLYAENPATGFLPSIGSLDHLEFPEELRVDTGVEQGGEVSPFYDPMIAKLIAWGETREEAIDRLRDGIDGTEIWPVKTNAGFLGRLLDLDDFGLGDVDTGLIAREVDDLVHPSEPEPEELAEAAALLCASPGNGPVSAILGFRLNAPPRAEARLMDDAGNLYVVPFDEVEADEPANEVLTFSAGFARRYTLERVGGGSHHSAHDGDILAPMPGKVIAVDVAQGQAVTAGQRLMVLEAMKMEHALTAPFDGTVTGLSVSAGSQVQVEALLVRVEAAQEDAA